MKKILVFGVLMFFGWFLSAQEESNSKPSKDLNSAVYMQQLVKTSDEALGLAPGTTNRRITIVRQIGNNNFLSSQTISKSAELSYLQIGDDNAIESLSSIQNFSERIIQKGNDNEVINYSVGPVESASFNLIQLGNNISFQKIGTNSQTDNMSIQLTGQDRTVIVRSY